MSQDGEIQQEKQEGEIQARSLRREDDDSKILFTGITQLHIDDDDDEHDAPPLHKVDKYVTSIINAFRNEGLNSEPNKAADALKSRVKDIDSQFQARVSLFNTLISQPSCFSETFPEEANFYESVHRCAEISVLAHQINCFAAKKREAAKVASVIMSFVRNVPNPNTFTINIRSKNVVNKEVCLSEWATFIFDEQMAHIGKTAVVSTATVRTRDALLDSVAGWFDDRGEKKPL